MHCLVRMFWMHDTDIYDSNCIVIMVYIIISTFHFLSIVFTTHVFSSFYDIIIIIVHYTYYTNDIQVLE